jgi:hypothetical protein
LGSHSRVVLQINGALPLAYPDNVNRAADYTCVVFVFVYALGYSMGFGPAAWVYGSEVWKKPPCVNCDLRPLPDLSHRCSCPRAEPGRILRRRWIHHCCPSMARRHCQPRFQNLFRLHGHQLGCGTHHLPPIPRDQGSGS